MTAERANKGGVHRVLALCAVLAAGCVVGIVAGRGVEALHSVGPAGAIAVAVLFAVAEITLIHVPLRRDTHSVSFNELPLTLGLFVCTPVQLIVASMVGSFVVLVTHRRQRGSKLVFNTLQVGIQVFAATVVFRALADGAGAASTRTYGAAFVAAVIADLLSALLVTLAITLYRSTWVGLGGWSLVFGVVASIAKTALGIVAVSVIVHEDAVALIPLVLTAACMYGAFRGHAALYERHRRLEMLYRFTRAVGKSVQLDDVARAVVTEARELLRTREATLLVSRSGMASITWSAVVEDDGTSVTVDMNAVDDTTTDDSRRLRAELATQSDADFVLSTVDPIGLDRTFDAVDARIFDALAAQAAIALENCSLVERLSDEVRAREYRATHDELTGLTNRSRMRDAVNELLASGESVAVLVAAIDQLAEIEETFGHHNANLVLTTIAGRMQHALGGESILSRLGRDAFGVLSAADHLDAARRRIREAVADDVELDGIRVAITVTMGCAVAPDDANDPDDLLRYADGGLRTARRRGTTFARHEHQAEADVRRRLTMAQELRRALERREFVVYFQPQVDLATGRAVGVEALVRWLHPERGLVPPDTFIGIAEQTGFIDALTDLVLGDALAQRRLWSLDGLECNMSVNISPRSFADAGFTERVMRQLVTHRCPADALTVEITESSLMADPERAVRVLGELHDLGVRVSIDDFGTGYSSLTSLRSLPLDEVKIDKSFVLSVPESDSDGVIVRSTAGLARNLQLAAVAEGVETEAARRFLVDIGVATGQGYLFAKPLPADDATRWLRANSPITDVVPAR